MKKLSTLLLFCFSTFAVFSQCTQLTLCDDPAYATESATGNYSNQIVPADPMADEDQDFSFKIFYPDVENACELPFILFLHGGGWHGGNKNSFEDLCDELAKRGCVAATVAYRLTDYDGIVCATGGTGSRYDVIRQASYKALQDARSAMRYFVHHAGTYNIDADNLFFAGFSAGAVTALDATYMSQSEANTAMDPDLVTFGSINDPALTANNYTDVYNVRGVIEFSGGIQHPNIIDAGEAIPALLFHHRYDNVAPFENGTFDYGCSPDFNVYGSKEVADRLDDLSIYYELNATQEDPPIVPGKHSVACFDLDYRANHISCFLNGVVNNDLGTSPTYQYFGVDDEDNVLVNCCGEAKLSQADQNGLKIYPVPAHDRIEVSFPDLQNEVNGTFEMEVYDMTGKRIMSKFLPENPSSVSLDMKPGFYIVKLLKNGHVMAVKEVIKM